MSQTFYSASIGGFFSSSLHGAALPADAVPVSGDDHAALMAAQAAGKEIIASADGTPQAVDRAVPAPRQLTLAQQAQAALDKSDVTVLRCIEAGISLPGDWVAYRQALRAIVNGTSTATILPARPAYPAGT